MELFIPILIYVVVLWLLPYLFSDWIYRRMSRRGKRGAGIAGIFCFVFIVLLLNGAVMFLASMII